jgi:hypothetical protein
MRNRLLIFIAAVSLLSSAAAEAADAADAAAQSDAVSSGGPGGSSRGQPDVTIRAKRADLEPRVSAFVDQIEGTYYDADGLARWQNPVCPLVTGLPGPEGEFILARISEIARAADIPLASENCRPNLYIFVSSQPQELLRGLDQRNHAFTYGDAPPNVVDEFISTPQPVRVWYHTAAKTPEGLPLVGWSWPEVASKKSGAISNGRPPLSFSANAWAESTHLSFNFIWTIYRAFVFVDTKRLHGISRGQLADYVAMVTLAQLKSGSHLADDPTILKLFDDTPQAAPASLSQWDQAFLKSLYATEQKSHLQRSQIARAMVREIVPE